MNKKGQQMPKGINLLLGLIMIAAGGLGLFGASIGITIPEIPNIIFHVLITLGGLVLLLDGFMGAYGIAGMSQLMPKAVNRIMGFLVFLSGVVLLLMTFGIVPSFAVPIMIMQGIILFAGVILLLDGFVGANNF